MDLAPKKLAIGGLHLTEGLMAEELSRRARLAEPFLEIIRRLPDRACPVASRDLTHDRTAGEYAALAQVPPDLKASSLPNIWNRHRCEKVSETPRSTSLQSRTVRDGYLADEDMTQYRVIQTLHIERAG